MAEELKCCPFCGHDGELVAGGFGEKLIRCRNQSCRAGLGGDCWHTTDADAALAWNRRVEPPAVSEERVVANQVGSITYTPNHFITRKEITVEIGDLIKFGSTTMTVTAIDLTPHKIEGEDVPCVITGWAWRGENSRYVYTYWPQDVHGIEIISKRAALTPNARTEK